MLNTNNQLKSLLFYILYSGCLLSTCSITACSSYQKHLGPKGHEYNKASGYGGLKYPDRKVRIEQSSRYQIPNIAISNQQQSTDYTTPPDYIGQIKEK